jgi:YgiT-type zinc finger domain-containing protein
MEPGFVTVTLEPAGTTLVIKRVPALVCDNCGEEYVDEAVAAELMHTARVASDASIQVEVREYAAARPG